MYELEIFDKDNLITLDDEYTASSIIVYPETKRYKQTMSLNEDAYCRTEIFEYKIFVDPIRVSFRLIERLDEPPKSYKVKDGVVLESEIKKSGSSGIVMELIENLKKDVEWHDLWPSSPDSFFILSKHPEILSKEEYRKFLRQKSEKIQSAISKVEQALQEDTTGLHIIDNYINLGRTIWYSELKEKEMSEEDIEKAREYANKFRELLFDEKSAEYIGISKHEFSTSEEILRNIDAFLNIKQQEQSSKSVNKDGNSTTKILKMIGVTILLLVVIQYLVSIFTTVFAAIFGYNSEQSYTNFRAIAILVSFAITIYLWIKGYKSIFKKVD